MIFTDKAAKEKIQSLESRITDLETDATAKDTEIENLRADVTAKDQTISEHVASIQHISDQLTASGEKIALYFEEIKTLKAEVETAKAAIPAAVTEALASIGQTEPLENIETPDTSAKTMKLEDFKKLGPAAKSSFCITGGKIID
jgi:chromosome segregation ATPase